MSLGSKVLAHAMSCPICLCVQHPSPLPSTSSASGYLSRFIPLGQQPQEATSNSPHPTSHPTHAEAVSSLFLAFAKGFFKTQMLSPPHGFFVKGRKGTWIWGILHLTLDSAWVPEEERVVTE